MGKFPDVLGLGSQQRWVLCPSLRVRERETWLPDWTTDLLAPHCPLSPTQEHGGRDVGGGAGVWEEAQWGYGWGGGNGGMDVGEGQWGYGWGAVGAWMLSSPLRDPLCRGHFWEGCGQTLLP